MTACLANTGSMDKQVQAILAKGLPLRQAAAITTPRITSASPGPMASKVHPEKIK